MHHPIVPLNVYENSLQGVRKERVGKLPTLQKKKMKCPLNKIHVKLQMLPSDKTYKDGRVIKYEGLSNFVSINSRLKTGLESYITWSKKLWIKNVVASMYISESLRSEELQKQLLNIEEESLNLNQCLVGFHLSHLVYGSIRFNKNLRRVDVSKNCLTPDATGPITMALYNNVNIKLYNISDNFLLPVGAMQIAEMLKNNNCLTALNISNCRLTDFGKNYDGILKLKTGLAGHLYLKHLDVSNNMLGTEGVLMVCEILCENYIIQTIDFSKNNYVETKDKRLIKLLEKASKSILLTRSRMTGVKKDGKLELIFHENIQILNIDQIQKYANRIYAARVKRMLDIEAFFSGRFRIPQKGKEPTPDTPPDSDAWEIINMLPPLLSKRVKNKLVGTIDCVLPFDE
jgi:hypothetical protein